MSVSDVFGAHSGPSSFDRSVYEVKVTGGESEDDGHQAKVMDMACLVILAGCSSKANVRVEVPAAPIGTPTATPGDGRSVATMPRHEASPGVVRAMPWSC